MRAPRQLASKAPFVISAKDILITLKKVKFMAHCPQKIKDLQTFRQMNVPTARQLYGRYGERVSTSGYTASLMDSIEKSEAVQMSSNKLRQVAQVKRYLALENTDE